MIEVEAKIHVKNPENIRKKIRHIAEFKGREKKTDDYYTLERLNKYPIKSLRIRKSRGFHVINFKQFLSYKNGVYAKREFEFKINDLLDFLKLMRDFGFKKWLTKRKMSEKYEINRDFHIELNYVKNLGWFLEIEYLTEKDINKARNRVLQVIKKLGINKKNLVKRGYTKMLWDKMH